jgi:hypothetical protein
MKMTVCHAESLVQVNDILMVRTRTHRDWIKKCEQEGGGEEKDGSLVTQTH